MTEEVKILNVSAVLKEAYAYMSANERNLHKIWLIHFALCAVFNLLPGGFSNPISLVWSLGYFVFWCVFFRIYYQKKPYFCFSKICASAIPSSKMIFITFVLLFFLLILPFLPLLMGFNNRYLLMFEKYMTALQTPSTSLLNVSVFSLLFLLISPFAFCRPYLAWISALQGFSGSVRKVFKKTVGNNLRFMLLMFLLNLPCILAFEIDTLLGCHGWFLAAFYSIYLIYCNVVFAKVYNHFYQTK